MNGWWDRIVCVSQCREIVTTAATIRLLTVMDPHPTIQRRLYFRIPLLLVLW